jgi:hypothetical protein
MNELGSDRDRAGDQGNVRGLSRSVVAVPLVIGVMVGCIALSIARLARLLAEAFGASSAGNPAYFFVFCVLAALEAYYGRRWVTDRAKSPEDLWKFRALEILLFVVLLKAGSYIGDSWDDVQTDVVTWVRYPARFLDTEMLLALLLAFLSWFAATQTIRDLERLEDPPEFHAGAYPPIDTLTTRFFWGGVVLLVVAGVTRVGIAALLEMDRPSVPGLVLNVLVYFLLGLVVLGQMRFVSMRRAWQSQKIDIAGRLRGQWVRYSLLFIGLAALLAFLLPTGYTVYLLDVLAVVVAILFQVVYLVASLLMLLISLPFWLLARLFLGDQSSAPAPSVPPMSPPPPPELRGGPADWIMILRVLLFWVVGLGIAFYLVRGFLREHPEVVQALRAFGPIRWLLALWRSLRRRFGAWDVAIRQRLARGREQGVAASMSGAARASRPGSRSNRGRVLYYYLNVVHRANRAGFHRRVSQTPQEYSSVLRRNLPEAREEMDTLTDAFVEARYSLHPVESDRVRQARTGWQRLKQVLRKLGRPRRRRRR